MLTHVMKGCFCSRILCFFLLFHIDVPILQYFADLNRQKLVALAILLGCDYLPQGVLGVGKENAMKLIRNVNHDNLIDR